MGELKMHCRGPTKLKTIPKHSPRIGKNWLTTVLESGWHFQQFSAKKEPHV